MSCSRISRVKVLMLILKEKLEHQCDQMVILSKKQILSLQHFSLLWFAWVSENHNTAPFFSKTQFQFSSNQTLYFHIYKFIYIYYIHIYTQFFKSPRICPHSEQLHSLFWWCLWRYFISTCIQVSKFDFTLIFDFTFIF